MNTKIKEWSDEFNSFNSNKGLVYYENYKAIADWKEGRRKIPPPPIEISMDIASICQLRCNWCNFGKYFDEKKERRLMPREHILKLVKFFSIWKEDNFKVHGICWGGGGESTLNPALRDGLCLAYKLGIENSIATNGINFNDELIDISANTCKWIGVSIDSATKNTYNINRKGNFFDLAVNNLRKLVKKVKESKANNDIAFKFLIFGYNQHEIFEACKLAKDIGVKDFHCRPCDFSHQGVKSVKKNPYNIEKIKEQFNKCHELEDKDFHVYTIVHKYNENFIPIKKFSQCFASPICLQVCPEESLFLCPDTRNLQFYKLGTHYPNPEEILNVWGSNNHYNLVFKTGCDNCKSRCTLNHYNYQCERLAINKDDPMCLSFV